MSFTILSQPSQTAIRCNGQNQALDCSNIEVYGSAFAAGTTSYGGVTTRSIRITQTGLFVATLNYVLLDAPSHQTRLGHTLHVGMTYIDTVGDEHGAISQDANPAAICHSMARTFRVPNGSSYLNKDFFIVLHMPNVTGAIETYTWASAVLEIARIGPLP
jgi:hypothetical protein